MNVRKPDYFSFGLKDINFVYINYNRMLLLTTKNSVRLCMMKFL